MLSILVNFIVFKQSNSPTAIFHWQTEVENKKKIYVKTNVEVTSFSMRKERMHSSVDSNKRTTLIDYFDIRLLFLHISTKIYTYLSEIKHSYRSKHNRQRTIVDFYSINCGNANKSNYTENPIE